MKQTINRFGLIALSVAALVMSGASAALANDLSEISENIVTSASNLPGLITALSYLLGLVLGISAIFKLKEHVENPNQTPIREPLIRALAGGALFALPIIYEAMFVSIGTGVGVDSSSGVTLISGLLGGALGFLGGLNILQDFNTILASILESVEEVPALIAAIGYLLGLVMGVTGILKLKEHIEAPQQVALREGVIRLLIGGSLLALPMIFEAMHTTIEGGGTGILGFLAGGVAGVGILAPTTSGGTGCLAALGGGLPIIGGLLFGGPTLGTAVCNVVLHTASLPAFLTAISYLFGLILGLWGLLKIKDHVLEPRQTSVWEGVSRLLAGGAFFALPVMLTAAYNTVGELLAPHFTTGFSGTTTTNGLDAVMANFMLDLMGPMNVLVNFFAFTAGIIFVMIGISRLMKSAQEGARGPGGIGTIATFLIGGALMAFSPMIAAASNTMFQTASPGITETDAQLRYVTGMGTAEVAHAHAVISSILRFMIVLGLISFMRGLFIIRGVAEGSSQASMMAGVTHIIGGALAVNLGPLMNAVQTTLGLSAYGVTFG